MERQRGFFFKEVKYRGLYHAMTGYRTPIVLLSYLSYPYHLHYTHRKLAVPLSYVYSSAQSINRTDHLRHP